jgi:potassium-transporting ATPase KdpC subunit
MKTLQTAFKFIMLMTVLTGIAYPLLITGIGRLFFARKAEGSLIIVGGKTVGSELIAQRFGDPRYFWPRPSAVDYNPLPSGGSNLGPTSAGLKDSIMDRRSRFTATDGTPVPLDLLCASGSGLDPHISPEAARYQLGRVAIARLLDNAQRTALLSLIDKYTETPTIGILGQPRINVLTLNLVLDSLTRM